MRMEYLTRVTDCDSNVSPGDLVTVEGRLAGLGVLGSVKFRGMWMTRGSVLASADGDRQRE